ncbi:MAG: hypothetical protein VYE18_08325 [Pseudomonadota bacterium]|nr:hypothetical protein [Pseudomonadota bacterium]
MPSALGGEFLGCELVRLAHSMEIQTDANTGGAPWPVYDRAM